MRGVGIVHSTDYYYRRPVSFATHRLMLRPRDSHDLRLLSATFGIEPAADRIRWAHDVFGNSIAFLDWKRGDTAEHLRITSRLKLEHFPSGAGRVLETMDASAELYPFSYAFSEYPDLARCIERQHPDPERRIDAWARRFLNRNGPTRTLALLTSINEAIRDEFAYAARHEEGCQTALVTLALRSGACRDFALFMMEATRALGFAVRFVSGYIYDEALLDVAVSVVGAGATHAWCEVYVPGSGWVEFDPTNGLIAGRNLIRVSTARTPEQAVPVGGGYIGEREDYLRMDVDVEVTVKK